jgi:type I restriction enzyme M protein
MAQLEHIEAIEKRLWNAADTLRANSNYASNEYFLPVMGLIFLRHAFSRYLAIKDEIEANLPKRGGKTRALTKEDFSQKSAIFFQPKAQFDYLVALPDSVERDKAKATVPLNYDARGDKLGIAVGNLNERIAEKLEELETNDIDVEQRLEKELKRDYHIITADTPIG